MLGYVLRARLDFSLAPEGAVLKLVAFKTLFTAPLIAVLVSWLVMKRSVRWGLAVAGIACPVVISVFYVFAVSWAGYDWLAPNGFQDRTHLGLFREFFRDATLMSALGGGIGLLLGIGIEKLAIRTTSRSAD